MSEASKTQNKIMINKLLFEQTPEGQQQYYKTFMESQKLDKLIKTPSNPLEDRPLSAKIQKEEKAINTSKVEKIQTGSDKVNDLVNCPIWLDMIEDATETPCWHNIFCEKWIVRTNICPICIWRYNKNQLVPNIPMRRLINEIIINCKNEGCEAKCTKANLKKHLESWLYEKVFCPNNPSCKSMLRKDLETHKSLEWEFRTIDWILMWGASIKLNSLYDHIHKICPKSLIPCKNNCGDTVERGELMYHVNSKCKFEIIPCMYKQTLIYQNGWDIKLKRCDMKDHLTECPFRVINWINEGCKVKLAFKDRQKHDGECKYKMINCRNNCGATFERKHEDEHFDVCELQMIRWPYYEMGCKTEILRKTNLTHLQSEAFNHSLLFIEGQNK